MTFFGMEMSVIYPNLLELNVFIGSGRNELYNEL